MTSVYARKGYDRNIKPSLFVPKGSWMGGVTFSYTHFELPIEYTDMTKRPDKITIVATSSRYGGEFEGSGMLNTKVVGQVAAGSTLWVDDFELSYY